MVKTLRISDENHKEMLKIQGQIQAKTGEFTSMDDVIAELVRKYKKKITQEYFSTIRILAVNR